MIMLKKYFLPFTICLFVFSKSSPALGADKQLWVDAVTTEAPAQLQLPSFAPVVEKLGRSVVNVSIEGKETVGPVFRRKKDRFGAPNQNQQEEGPNSPFDFFLPFPMEPEGKRSFTSLGSGFVINKEGYIVTNNHVVEKATKILVTFRNDKTPHKAKLVGSDQKTDLALLKVDVSNGFDAAVLGDSDKLQPGDWVIAIGNPFRLGHTATVGIVSAKSRRLVGGGPYSDFIQTDASINPGNSGGPLFNSRGEVVGVNTAIFSPGRYGATGFNIGIGFATPINIVKRIISQLHNSGKVTRGWLGVLIQPVSPDVAEALKLKNISGALVADVMDKSPAATSGFQRGDVIVKYDGHEVNENDDLPLMVAETPIGKEVVIDLVRKGEKKQIKTTIQELKDGQEDSETAEESSEETKLGLTVQDITPDIAKSLGIDESKGVLVSNVSADSVAFEAGLRRGDIILEVGSITVNSSKEFRAATKDLEKNKPLLLLVKRDQNTIFLTLKVE